MVGVKSERCDYSALFETVSTETLHTCSPPTRLRGQKDLVTQVVKEKPD